MTQQGLCFFLRKNSATFVGYVKQNKTGMPQIPSLLVIGRKRFQKRPEIYSYNFIFTYIYNYIYTYIQCKYVHVKGACNTNLFDCALQTC